MPGAAVIVSVKAAIDCQPKGPAAARTSPWKRILAISSGLRRSLRADGWHRTAQFIRENAGTFRVARQRGCLSFVGRQIDLDERVAGFWIGAPSLASRILVREEQFARVPEGLSDADAACILPFACALAARDQILGDNTAQSVQIFGTDLASTYLAKLLNDAGVPVERGASVSRGAMSAAQQCRGPSLTIARVAQEGGPLLIHSDVEQPSDDRERAVVAHIGVPPASEANLSPYHPSPLALPQALASAGLAQALDTMAGLTWRPSDLLQGAGSRLAHPSAHVPTPRSPSSVVIPSRGQPLNVGIIGVGGWAGWEIIPGIRSHGGARICAIADKDPSQLEFARLKFGATSAVTDPAELLAATDIDAVFIVTGHDSHTPLTCAAIAAGKKVFVEKPPVVSYEGLDDLLSALSRAPAPWLAVGYNRPFAPLTAELRRQTCADHGPVTISGSVRLTRIPPRHHYFWPGRGTRILSNGCHWLDFADFLLAPRKPVSVQTISSAAGPAEAQDRFTVVVRYDDGSHVSFAFSQDGDERGSGHELISIQTNRGHMIVEDFRELKRWHVGAFASVRRSATNRGHRAGIHRAIDAMTSGTPLRSFEDMTRSALLSLDAQASFLSGGLSYRFERAEIEGYLDRARELDRRDATGPLVPKR